MHGFVRDGRLQEAVCGTDARRFRDHHRRNAKLLGNARRMQRAGATGCDQHAAFKFLACVGSVDARGVRHVFIDDFANARSRIGP